MTWFDNFTWVDLLGWIGSFQVLAAYGLNSYQRIKSDSWTFLLLNICGGVLLIVYTIYKQAYANTFINIAWVVIALPALIRLVATRKNSAQVERGTEKY